MASDNKVVSDVKLQKIVDKLRAIKDRQQLQFEPMSLFFAFQIICRLLSNPFNNEIIYFI